MSATATPITPQAFAEALKSLPLSSLYAKASELRNSIAHLQRSNDELARYMAEETPDGRDKDCEEAIQENEVVMLRMQERIELVKAEVEGRGQRWSEEMELEMEMETDLDDVDVNVNGGVEGGDVVHAVAPAGPRPTGAGARARIAANSDHNRNGDALPTTGVDARPTGAQNNPAVNAGRNGGVDDQSQEGESGVYL
ncbi:hypothetical protein ACJ72_04242 [Emergomyces africanus]|uniref:Uncharacterized protein n=1 Tax=Emergomyces africanus TaxID=1955775 RepID=A0A1B7NXB2_9EURO|nr:hypothetical protein ACJ72_04242 [Emergomyces africanus]